MIRCLGPGWRLRWGFWPVLYYPTPAKCFRACSEVTDARALLEKWPHDCRKPGSRDGRIPGGIAQRRGGRGRRPHLRLERIEVLDFGRVQQVSPSPVVVRAECGAPHPGLRGPQWQSPADGAEARPVASVEAGDLQGPRSPHAHSPTGGAGDLSGALATGDRKALSRLHPYEAK